MGERVSDTVSVRASTDTVLGVIIDLEAYPDWIDDVKRVEVSSRDDDGRPHEATFNAAAAGIETSYSLRYAYADDEVTWELVDSEVLSQLDGSYTLGADGGTVEVRYTLEGDVSIPLPRFMKRRFTKRILDEGLRGLKARAESLE